jgi:hypothetical protein
MSGEPSELRSLPLDGDRRPYECDDNDDSDDSVDSVDRPVSDPRGEASHSEIEASASACKASSSARNVKMSESSATCYVLPRKDLAGDQQDDDADQDQDQDQDDDQDQDQDQDQDDDNEDKGPKKDVIYIKLIAKAPKTSFAIGCTALLAIAGIILGTMLLSGFAMSTSVPVADWSLDADQREDSFLAALSKRGSPDAVLEPQSVPRYSVSMLYEAKDNERHGRTAVTYEEIVDMKNIENRMMRADEYNLHCYADSASKCLAPKSILSYLFQFDAPSHQWTGTTTQQEIDDVFDRIAQFNASDSDMLFFVDEDFSASVPVTKYTRTVFYQALPLTRLDSDYKNDFDEVCQTCQSHVKHVNHMSVQP